MKWFMLIVVCQSLSPQPRTDITTVTLASSFGFGFKLMFFILQVVDFYNYDDIGEVTTIKSSSLQIVMHTGGRVLLTTNKAGELRS